MLEVLLLGTALAAGGVERAIELSGAGPVVVTLDRDVYEWSRPDLGDLRVQDEAGREAPYLIERALEDEPGDLKRPVVRDRTFVRGQQARLTLDFGAPTLKDRLTLALSGDNFRRRVVVEGRGKNEPEWETLTDSAYVFAVPEPAAARYETVLLPENNHRFLRVTVFHGPDDPDRIEIADAWVRPDTRRRPREIALAPRLQRLEDGPETHLVVDLGARHQPFRGLVLEVGDSRFFRGVVVEARVDPREPGIPLAWKYVADGVLYRYDEGAERREGLRIDVTGRERVLRVRIRNRDDAPLDVKGVTAMVPVERLVFEAASGPSYRLAYGEPDRTAPTYDLARTIGDAALLAARATPGRMGAPAPAQGRPPAPRPWTERHPALLWAGLVAVTVALAMVTLRALRSAP